jgi:hypothetical protein
MGSYHIDIRFADGSARRCRELTGDLGEACGIALALAEEEARALSLPNLAWIDLYEGEVLHISISIVPGLLAGSVAEQPPTP